MTTVIAQRSDSAGKPEETIQEEETISKRFYPATPDGPFVTKRWPSKFEYFIVDKTGKKQELKFLTTRDAYEQYLAFFPISNGRWIAINRLESAPISEGIRVCVFNGHGVLSSNIVGGCVRNDDSLFLVAQRNPPMRSTIKFYEYEFDVGREEVSFKTKQGDFVVDANAGTLRKITRE